MLKKQQQFGDPAKTRENIKSILEDNWQAIRGIKEGLDAYDNISDIISGLKSSEAITEEKLEASISLIDILSAQKILLLELNEHLQFLNSRVSNTLG